MDDALKNIDKKQEEFGIDFRLERVNTIFKTDWIQDAMNHRAIFDTFYRDIVPNQSLVIAYTKQVLFVEDTRRVIIGMGHVKRYIPKV